MQEFTGDQNHDDLRVAVVVSRYHETITAGLLESALMALKQAKIKDEDIALAWVPGALELPAVAAEFARLATWDAVVVLGAVIRGQTDHYDQICRETSRGCSRITFETGVPVGFGVITCDTLAQATDRSTTPAKNKGGEAARAVIETARVLMEIRAATELRDESPQD